MIKESTDLKMWPFPRQKGPQEKTKTVQLFKCKELGHFNNVCNQINLTYIDKGIVIINVLSDDDGYEHF